MDWWDTLSKREKRDVLILTLMWSLAACVIAWIVSWCISGYTGMTDTYSRMLFFVSVLAPTAFFYYFDKVAAWILEKRYPGLADRIKNEKSDKENED